MLHIEIAWHIYEIKIFFCFFKEKKSLIYFLTHLQVTHLSCFRTAYSSLPDWWLVLDSNISSTSISSISNSLFLQHIYVVGLSTGTSQIWQFIAAILMKMLSWQIICHLLSLFAKSLRADIAFNKTCKW